MSGYGPAGGHLASLWWSQLEPDERTLVRDPLPGPRDADVVIVGAGFTGLWTAYYLAKADPRLRIVVLDAATAGAGASGRNGGWASAILPIGWSAVAARHGREATLAWQGALDATLAELARVVEHERIDAGFAHDGYLEVATNPAQVTELRHQLAEARRWGRREADLRRLTATETRDLVNSPAALAGLFTPHCAVVQPAKLVRGLAHAVERLGVAIHEGTPAVAARPGVVSTPVGAVRAPVVLMALEAYVTQLQGRRAERLPVYSTMIATEPLPPAVWAEIGWSRRVTFKDFRRRLFYAQRTTDGRIAFGGRGAPYRFGSRIDDPVANLPVWRDLLQRTLREVLPQVARAEITHAWGGVLGVPRDWMPSVRFDPVSGFGAAGGYSGDGVALSNLAGRTLAALVTGADSDLVRLPWVGHRSRHWEPEPLRWMGTAVGERLAGLADATEARTGRPSATWGRAFSLLTGR